MIESSWRRQIQISFKFPVEMFFDHPLISFELKLNPLRNLVTLIFVGGDHQLCCNVDYIGNSKYLIWYQCSLFCLLFQTDLFQFYLPQLFSTQEINFTLLYDFIAHPALQGQARNRSYNFQRNFTLRRLEFQYTYWLIKVT